jgi:hypothetical protein
VPTVHVKRLKTGCVTTTNARCAIVGARELTELCRSFPGGRFHQRFNMTCDAKWLTRDAAY